MELTGKLTDAPTALPDDLPDLPRELSFWIGAHLGGPVADQQQELLEQQSQGGVSTDDGVGPGCEGGYVTNL